MAQQMLNLMNASFCSKICKTHSSENFQVFISAQKTKTKACEGMGCLVYEAQKIWFWSQKSAWTQNVPADSAVAIVMSLWCVIYLLLMTTKRYLTTFVDHSASSLGAKQLAHYLAKSLVFFFCLCILKVLLIMQYKYQN